MVNPNDNEIKNLMWLMTQREYWLLREDGEQRIGTITGTIGPIIADIEINIIKSYCRLQNTQYIAPKDGFERAKMAENIIKEVEPQNTRK